MTDNASRVVPGLQVLAISLLLVTVPLDLHADSINVDLIKESQQHYQAATEALNRGDLQTGRNEMAISVEKAEKGNMPPAGLGPLYYDFGAYLELTLEWELAQQTFANAIYQGQAAHLAPAKMVDWYYEYGRTSGIICKYDLAETNLKMAYGIDTEVGNPTATDVFELALLQEAAGKLPESLAYFTRAKDLMDRSDAAKNSPAQYSQFLTAYAAALESAGQDAKAGALKQQAEALSGSNVQGDSGLTPYGSQCGTSSGK